MSKIIKKIIWKTWEPQTAANFPCLCCRAGREATHQVIINDVYFFPACLECAELPEKDFRLKLHLPLAKLS